MRKQQWWTAEDLRIVKEQASALIRRGHSKRIQLKSVAPAQRSKNYEVWVVKKDDPHGEDCQARISKYQLDNWRKTDNVAAIQEHLDRQLQMCFSAE